MSSELYTDRFIRQCKACGADFKKLPHEPERSYCVSCLGTRWEQNEDAQMKYLKSIDSTLKKIAKTLEAAK